MPEVIWCSRSSDTTAWPGRSLGVAAVPRPPATAGEAAVGAGAACASTSTVAAAVGVPVGTSATVATAWRPVRGGGIAGLALLVAGVRAGATVGSGKGGAVAKAKTGATLPAAAGGDDESLGVAVVGDSRRRGASGGAAVATAAATATVEQTHPVQIRRCPTTSRRAVVVGAALADPDPVELTDDVGVPRNVGDHLCTLPAAAVVAGGATRATDDGELDRCRRVDVRRHGPRRLTRTGPGLLLLDVSGGRCRCHHKGHERADDRQRQGWEQCAEDRPRAPHLAPRASS